MKTIITIIVTAFISLPALATETFKVDGVRTQFYSNKEKRITVNDVCKTQKTCMALQVLNKVSKNSLNAGDLYGGANPGPLLCLQVKGEVVMGEDLKGNQNSFCRFKDGSIVDNGTLTYYGIMNDRKNN